MVLYLGNPPGTGSNYLSGTTGQNRTITPCEGSNRALERMDVLGPVRIGRALTFPEFAFVRGDPRVKALCKKVGLPE